MPGRGSAWTKRLIVGMLLALLVPCAAAYGTTSAASSGPTTAVAGSVAGSVATGSSASVQLRPPAVPLSAEVPNPGRGQSKWQGIEPAPTGWPTSDVYYRDQVYWGRIEKQRGTYDFSTFDEGLADAAAHGGKFDFRVMAWCPGCWMEYSSNPDKPPATPTWLPRQSGTWRPPEWNSEAFLTAWEQLMTELGRRYADDPRLGWVDIGGYGAYGEGYVTEGTPITTENALRMARAVLQAFPRSHVLVNAMDPALVLPVLQLSPRVGWRHDCLGAAFFGWFADQPVIRDRWKTAPVSSEWCHSGDTTMAQGRDQVRAFHVSSVSSSNMPVPYDSMSDSERAAFRSAAIGAGYRYGVERVDVPARLRLSGPVPVRVTWNNVGSAPTYDPWSVRLGLADRTGAVRSVASLSTDLRKVLPGRLVLARNVRFGTRVPAGSYSLVVQVSDPSGDRVMRLPIRNGRAGGWYPLGTVSVG